jgi:hypothetical protein
MRPLFSISQITTLGSTFVSDLSDYAAAGVDGIGIWEIKLRQDGDHQALEQLEASGLGTAAAVPAVPSILPLPLMEGPSDPRARIDATGLHSFSRAPLCASPGLGTIATPSSKACARSETKRNVRD